MNPPKLNKVNSILRILAALALTICAPAAWPEDSPTRVDGRITDAGKSLVGVQVVLSHEDTLQVFRATTDKYGTFSISDVPRGIYVVSVLNAAGDKLFRKTLELTSAPDAPIRLDIEISAAPGGPPSNTAPAPAPARAPAPQDARNAEFDALVRRYESAQRAGDHQAAIAALKAIVAADPSRWDYFDALGNAQMEGGDYEGAAQSLGKGAQAAQQFLSSTPSNPSAITKSDRERAKAGMAHMLISEGNAWLKLKKNDEAIAAYTKAAELAPDPAIAYFNLCVVHYNTRKLDGALEACDKAIAGDANRADAYFIKGSLLFWSIKVDKDGKVAVPAGTTEALKKYLELAPAGPYASDAKQMLDYIGAKARSSERGAKKP